MLESLPEEIVSEILSYLTFKDIKLVSEVNWNFFYLCHRIFINKFVVHIYFNIAEGFYVFSNAKRSYKHLILKNIQYKCFEHAIFRKFIEKFRCSLSSLQFKSCEFTNQSLVNIFSMCQLLEFVRFENCDQIFDMEDMRNKKINRILLPNLRKLHINKVNDLNDAVISKLFENAPKLNHLTLSYCKISYHSSVYKRFYPKRLANENSSSSYVLTFDHILKLINEQNFIFHGLALNNTNCIHSAVEKLINLKNLDLQDLQILGSTQFPYCIVNLLKHFKNLRTLKLDLSQVKCKIADCCKVLDETLKNLQKLELILNCCILPGSLNFVNKLQNLSSLSIIEMQSILTDDLYNVFNSPFKNLKLLNLTQCGLNDSHVEKITLSIKNVKVLILKGNKITECSLGIILTRLRLLKHLNVSCSSIGDTVNEYYVECGYVPHLKYLDLHSTAITDKTLSKYLTFFQELDYLDVSSCKYLTTNAFLFLSKHCPWIRALCMRDCPSFELRYTKKLLTNFKKMKSLLVKMPFALVQELKINTQRYDLSSESCDVVYCGCLD